TKGRDFYDLVWYLGRKVSPNLDLLNNAIQQTEKKALGITTANLTAFMLAKLERVDFNAAVADVRRFILDENELRVINKNSLSSLVSGMDWK
ncbi:MAG: nucleotidyl transferase AbiEii/AbiGii toxin family protein, partial [Elusimicrobiota bacterium]